MAVLEEDREPAPEQWDRLFVTPGYAVLVTVSNPFAFFRLYSEAARKKGAGAARP